MGAWSGDQIWEELSWGDDAWGGHYLRSLSTLTLASKPIDISDRYKANAEDDGGESSSRVPIQELIIKDTGKHCLWNRKGKVR